MTGWSEYISIHLWLVRHYGRASVCEARNCSGKAKRFDWALKRGYKYKKDVSCFYQLCRSCHKRYDMGADMEFGHYELSEIPSGRTSDHLKKKIRLVETGRVFDSIIEASRIMNISRQSISGVVCGRRKTAHGLKWEYVS